MGADFLGREIVTAAELDDMTPHERQASFEESLVLDPGPVPDDFQQRVLRRVGPRIMERDQEQAEAARSRRHPEQ